PLGLLAIDIGVRQGIGQRKPVGQRAPPLSAPHSTRNLTRGEVLRRKAGGDLHVGLQTLSVAHRYSTPPEGRPLARPPFWDEERRATPPRRGPGFFPALRRRRRRPGFLRRSRGFACRRVAPRSRR